MPVEDEARADAEDADAVDGTPGSVFTTGLSGLNDLILTA